MGGRISLGIGVLVLAAAACGDDDASSLPVADAGIDSPEADATAPPEAGPTKVACAELVGMTVAATDIGLPTTGAVVTGATDMAADGAALPAHCLVRGNIMPVDKAAPNIQFELALPVSWNQKALFIGGGGFDGAINDVTAAVALSPPTAVSPLTRGYAVFADDGGHESTAAIPTEDGSALVNDEAYANWLSDAPKKTRDVVMAIIKSHYGALPTKSYAFGGSTGGREVLADIGRFGADWDGAIVYYPARNAIVTVTAFVNLAQVLAAPGAFPSPAKRKVLYDAVLAACDSLDGAADGIVSNVATCATTFDPSVTRCAGGADTGDTCLSDAQLAAFASIDAPVTFDSALPTGDTDFAGFNVYLGSTGGTTASTEPLVQAYTLGATAPTFPVSATGPASAVLADGFYRYAVTRDPDFDILTMNVHNFGSAAARVNTLSALDNRDLDLTAFTAKGGKVLMAQGTADMLVSARSTERYVATVSAKLGAATTEASLRYYEIPGMQHGVSAVFQSAWDSLTALEKWVEAGTDPAENEIVTDLVGVPGRSRPLCRYPAFPKYSAGDMNDAKSFTCQKP